MDIQVTKDSAILFSYIYKEYLRRKKKGISYAKSINFNALDDFESGPCAKMNQREILHCADELQRAGLVRSYAVDFSLTDDGITYAEQRGLKDEDIQKWIDRLISAVSAVVPLLP